MSYLYEIPSGQIAEGVQYQVVGTGTSIVYNSVTYNIGDYFVGVAGVTDYTKTDGTEIVTEASAFTGFAIGEYEEFFLGKFTDDSTFKGMAFGTSDPKPGRIVRTIMPHDIPEKIESFIIRTDQTSLRTVGIRVNYQATVRAPDLVIDWGDGSPTETVTPGVQEYHGHSYQTNDIFDITVTGAVSGITWLEITGNITNVIDLSANDMQLLDLGDNKIQAIDLSKVTMNGILRIDNNSQLSAIVMPAGVVTELNLHSCNLTSLDIKSNINGSVDIDRNYNLTTVVFSGSVNTIVGGMVMQNCNLIGTLDLSNVDISGNIRLYENNNLEKVLFKPDNQGEIVTLDINNCNITDVLDLSTLKFKDATVRLYSNANMTGILLPDNGSTIVDLRVNSCNISGVLDLSKLIFINAYISALNNGDLTNIIFPNNSEIRTLYASTCNLTGTLDLSTATFVGGGTVSVSTNPNLQHIVFNSNVDNKLGNLYAYVCDLTGELDVSMFSEIGKLFVEQNANLTSIKFPDTTLLTPTQIDVSRCDITGTLDLRNVPVTYKVLTYSNPNLTEILFADSGNELVIDAEFYNTGLTGTLDLSNVEISAKFNISSNPALTGVIFGNTSPYLNGSFYVNNTGLTSIDLTGFIIGYTFTIGNNPDLETIIWPTTRHTSSIRTFSIMTNPKITEVNLDSFNLSGTYGITITGNSMLTTIINDTSNVIKSNSASGIVLQDNPALTSIDISNMDSGNSLQLQDCTSLTSVTFGSSHRFNFIYLTNTAITTLDLSTVDLTSGPYIYAENSALETYVGLTLGTSVTKSLMFNGAQISSFDIKDQHLMSSSNSIDVRNNNMTTAEVDAFLINVADGPGLDNEARILITEGNEPRSSASDVAYNSLIGEDWVIN